MRSSTIYDVAQAADVSTSTVSRAFSAPDRVRAATREHVLETARRLGYQPNPHARALVSRRTQTVAMVVSDITNPHFFELIRGAELRAKASGYTLVLVNAEESPRIELEQIQRLTRSVDGFLLAASRQPAENLLQLAATQKVVVVNRRVPGLASVVLEHAEGCRQMVSHLASLGHESVVYLAGPQNSWMAASRWAAIRAAAAELGVHARRMGPFTPTVASGGAAADAALTTDATAAIAHNDLLAIGVLRRLADRGVRVPADVSVVGFDDIFAADLCTPTLTTLGGAHADVGRAAVELLLTSMDQYREQAPQLVVPSELILRRSTGSARTSDLSDR
ncbi:MULTISPECIES: LacI family DNA-binding transcriptional regulator [unclassified Modestobacter]|uniref:LacI family DNA-binding transcriptional regulator n=1 Tax=unclassified Modestobacter TaxID=2643866 RepID=UPI0022AB424B|nr:MULTISPECIES: LacI family DNA-binding transcriptional regulator [unclassified Modestobacter]MCZ2818153.1 LacI family DNA-binding transcriptional regulator [Modestobacter sp. VKM Ac-2984]MCZ2839597.1 LacI family DNA-binding transcriptional regulator [Modestobacter sp. VKM Ac-2985]